MIHHSADSSTYESLHQRYKDVKRLHLGDR